MLTAVVLIVAAVGPTIFPAAQAGYAKMSALAGYFLLPSVGILFIALLAGKALGEAGFVNRVIAGLVSGILATIALEVVREFGFQMGWMPGSLPKLLGVLITDRFLEGPSLYSNLAGWAYHFWNGACFGMVYAVIFGKTRWWYATIYGVFIGIVFMVSPSVTALGIGYFGLQFGWGFPITVTIAHIAFGTALGLMLNKGFNFKGSSLFDRLINNTSNIPAENKSIRENGT
ncbi:MAG: hypothetical protein WD000_03625 [Thermodesulfobacteriota bacterium]